MGTKKVEGAAITSSVDELVGLAGDVGGEEPLHYFAVVEKQQRAIEMLTAERDAAAERCREQRRRAGLLY